MPNDQHCQNRSAIRREAGALVLVTTGIARICDREALVEVNGVPHKAMADQIRTVAKERLSNRLGQVARSELLAVERAIRVQLGLP